MLNVMAMPMHAADKTLGVGTYYERSGESLCRLKDWICVKLERPLILDEEKVRNLEQQYATNSKDTFVAMSGAWKLRRDIIGLGYDSIIAVIGPGRVKVVYLRRHRSDPAERRQPGIRTAFSCSTNGDPPKSDVQGCKRICAEVHVNSS